MNYRFSFKATFHLPTNLLYLLTLLFLGSYFTMPAQNTEDPVSPTISAILNNNVDKESIDEFWNTIDSSEYPIIESSDKKVIH